MNIFPYEMKRAHWKITWWAIRRWRRFVKKLKLPELWHMTPARYDILFVMWQRPHWVRRTPDDEYWARFPALIEKLGLHPTTITKCVQGLVKHGFVTVERLAYDGRKKMIRMTRLGLRVFEAAMDLLFSFPREAFFRANARFAFRAPRGEKARYYDDLHDVIWTLHALGLRLRRCARELGSRAWPIYDPGFVDPQLRYAFAALRA